MDSYTSFYRTARRSNEEFFRNLQLPTRSDLARVAELVVATEEKVDHIEDAFEDFVDGYAKVATIEAVEGLEGRLSQMEKKLDILPLALEKIEAEAMGGLGRLESRSEALPAALEKIEALARRQGEIESKLDRVLDALEKIATKKPLETSETGEAGETGKTAAAPRKAAKKNAKRPEVSNTELEVRGR
jgi:hypothetical protein